MQNRTQYSGDDVLPMSFLRISSLLFVLSASGLRDNHVRLATGYAQFHDSVLSHSRRPGQRRSRHRLEGLMMK